MANIRIHELAKTLGLTSKAVLAKAQELGFPSTTASSSLNESQVESVRAAFMPAAPRRTGAAPAPRPSPYRGGGSRRRRGRGAGF